MAAKKPRRFAYIDDRRHLGEQYPYQLVYKVDGKEVERKNISNKMAAYDELEAAGYITHPNPPIGEDWWRRPWPLLCSSQETRLDGRSRS